jgi:hypothetical protein
MNDISPKKYIETKARNLTLYKCLVNKNWEIGRMANVLILRKHKNGKLTVGYYLIDLMCLGVKDSFYHFDIYEDVFFEKMNEEINNFEEIDYGLAHNIIFAGYEFAQEYNIPPHKEFALTKFILEEDDDNIPLIEVEVGDENDGKPHLVINELGQGKWAINILEKSAGKGNYYVTYDDLQSDEEIEDESKSISDYPENEISPYEAKLIVGADLMDKDLLEKRSFFEYIFLSTENSIRQLKTDKKNNLHSQFEFEDSKELEEFESCTKYFIGKDDDDEVAVDDLINKDFVALSNIILHEKTSKKNGNKAASEFLEKYKDNFNVLVFFTMDYLIHSKNFKDCNPIKYFIPFEKKYKLAKLFCYTNDILYKEDYPINAKEFFKLLDAEFTFNTDEYGELELEIIWFLKAMASIKNRDLKNAVFYYDLLAVVDFESSLKVSLALLMFTFLAQNREISKEH